MTPPSAGQIRRHDDGRCLLLGQWSRSTGTAGGHKTLHLLPVIQAPLYTAHPMAHPHHPGVMFILPDGWRQRTDRNITRLGADKLRSMPVVSMGVEL